MSKRKNSNAQMQRKAKLNDYWFSNIYMIVKLGMAYGFVKMETQRK